MRSIFFVLKGKKEKEKSEVLERRAFFSTDDERSSLVGATPTVLTETVKLPLLTITY